MIAQLEMPYASQPLTKYRQLAAEVRSHKDEVKVFTAKDWHPTPLADAMLRPSSRTRRPKPALPPNGTHKFTNTSCDCGAPTPRDAEGFCLYQDANEGICAWCYADGQNLRAAARASSGRRFEGDNAGVARLRVVQEEHRVMVIA